VISLITSPPSGSQDPPLGCPLLNPGEPEKEEVIIGRRGFSFILIVLPIFSFLFLYKTFFGLQPDPLCRE
jgi:hypothetical protein